MAELSAPGEIAERVAADHLVVEEDRTWFCGCLSRVEREIRMEIAKEAGAILDTTVAAEGGRQFLDREAFGRCLTFLAILTDDPKWDFLRGG